MLKLLSLKKPSDYSSDSHFCFTFLSSLKTELESIWTSLTLSVINNLSKKNISKNYEEMGVVQNILKLQLHGDLTSVNFYRSGSMYYVHINSSWSPGTKLQGLLLLCNTSICLMPAFCFSNSRK